MLYSSSWQFQSWIPSRKVHAATHDEEVETQARHEESMYECSDSRGLGCEAVRHGASVASAGTAKTLARGR